MFTTAEGELDVKVPQPVPVDLPALSLLQTVICFAVGVPNLMRVEP